MLSLMLLNVSLTLASPPSRPPPPAPRLADTLDAITLSDATRAALDVVLADARPELESLHEALREREHQLLDDVRAAMTPDERAAFDAAMPPPPARRDSLDGPR
jgi:hypothetical protein